MRRASLVLPLILVLALGRPCAAHEHEGHDHEAIPAEKLGTVQFTISAAPDVQRDFNRATALLHSFQYELAELAFRMIADAKPDLGMAQWGIAMCNYHPIWAAPNAAELQRGREAAEKAASLGASTDRERAYIEAIGAFYKGDGVEYAARKGAYEDAMAKLHAQFPDDMEGTIFYALALLGTAPATDKTYAKQKQAADLLNGVLPKAPDHPGVAHYLIHSLDYPALATLALPAARAYAKIAPSSAHAQHMPSHIFTRLGLWDESVRSNLASAKTDRELMAHMHPGATGFNELHALDYLEYAYLQLGSDEKAKGVVAQIRKVAKVNEPQFAAAYSLAAVPARYALERRQWKEAAALTVSPAWFPWKENQEAEAVTHWAKAVGAARSGDVASAESELGVLNGIHDALLTVKKGYDWAGQVEVQRLSAQGWIARAKKNDEEAVAKLRAAADLEDSIDKHPVTPGAVLPAREQLADLLVELGKPEQAVSEYEAVLKNAPGRRNSLRGLESTKRAEAPGNPAAASAATDPASAPRSR